MKHLARPKFFSATCRRYGNVLLGLPKETLDTMLQELNRVQKWFAQHPSAWSLFCAVPPLAQVSHEVLTYCENNAGPWSRETRNMLFLLQKNHRVSLFSELLSYVQEKCARIENVYITTAAPLSKSVLSKIVDFFLTRYGVTVCVHQATNETLILGGVVIWNSLLIDLSLITPLKLTEKRISHEIFKTTII